MHAFNKKHLTTVALALVAGASFTGTAAAQGIGLPTALYLDGYCDGFVDIGPTGSKTYQATYDALTYCGGYTAQSGGPVARNLPGTGALKKGVAFTVETYPVYGVTLTWSINVDNTWVITDTAGNVINAGTWTAATALTRPAGTTPSYSK